MDRSHLLQGLRTGGPNKLSFGAQQPMSANPNVSRFQTTLYDDGQSLDAFHIQQQQQQLAMLQAQAQAQAQAQMAVIMQGGATTRETQALMQMEMLRLQALQQQQQNLQAQLLLQSQIAVASQQQQQIRRRASEQQHSLPSPALASPITPSIGNGLDAQTTRMSAANQLRARAIGREAAAAVIPEEQPQQVSPPPSANRVVSTPLNPNAAAFVGRFNPDLAMAIAAANNRPGIEVNTPSTPTYGSTTVISGGTSLGGANSGATTPSTTHTSTFSSPNVSATPTKADTATSWRRGSASVATTPITNNTGFNKPPSPPLRQRSASPPSDNSISSGLARLSISAGNSSLDIAGTPSSAVKIRPSPLRFNKATNENDSPVVATSIRSQSPSGLSNDGDAASNHSSSTSPTNSTPPSSASSDESHKKAEREEASKRLYEGLGIGRPAPSPSANKTQFNVNAAPFTLPPRSVTVPTPARQESVSVQVMSVPHRQPIGPPSSAEELGPRNFASRLRKKALGGLGVLMEAKDRREGCAVEVTAY